MCLGAPEYALGAVKRCGAPESVYVFRLCADVGRGAAEGPVLVTC